MTQFCDFVPDDPSCKTTDPVVPDNGGTDPVIDDNVDDGGDAGGDAGKDDMHDKDWPKDDKKAMTWEEFDEAAGEYFSPMTGNLAYFSIAAGFCADIALRTFLWHADNADTLSQAASGSGNTDYYSLLHKIEAYTGLGIWGLAAMTQLLATFGIMVGINMLVWSTLLPLVEGGLAIAVAALSYLAYDQFFKQSTLATPNATAGTYLAAMEREMALHAANHIAAHFEMYHEAHNWIWAAYMNSDPDTKKEFRKDKDFLMMLNLTEDMVKDWGMDGEKEMMEEDMKKEDSKMTGPPSLILKLVNM